MVERHHRYIPERRATVTRPLRARGKLAQRGDVGSHAPSRRASRRSLRPRPRSSARTTRNSTMSACSAGNSATIRSTAAALSIFAAASAAGSSVAVMVPASASIGTASARRRARPRLAFNMRRRAIVNTYARKPSSSPSNFVSARATSSQTWAAMSSASCGSRALRYRKSAGCKERYRRATAHSSPAWAALITRANSSPSKTLITSSRLYHRFRHFRYSTDRLDALRSIPEVHAREQRVQLRSIVGAGCVEPHDLEREAAADEHDPSVVEAGTVRAVRVAELDRVHPRDGAGVGCRGRTATFLVLDDLADLLPPVTDGVAAAIGSAPMTRTGRSISRTFVLACRARMSVPPPPVSGGSPSASCRTAATTDQSAGSSIV